MKKKIRNKTDSPKLFSRAKQNTKTKLRVI